MAEGNTKRRFGLNVPKIELKSPFSKRAQDTQVTTEADETDTIPAENVVNVQEVAKRKFAISLPFLRRKPDTGGVATPGDSPTKQPRKNESFKDATLVVTSSDEAADLSTKLQVLFARLTPSERTPKAFAGRPDPFDRLANEVKRKPTRRA